jgi:TRAP-type C4-dicarboxylate transport system permease small subunit
MNPLKLIAGILIALGCLGLIYGSFSYTRESTALKIGSLEVKVDEKETVIVPLVASGGAIVIGVILLAVAGRK